MIIASRTAKTILTKSKIPGIQYCLNPYIGCQHACRYCYADFMKKYTNHSEPWGEFVDVKLNSVELLAQELPRLAKGKVLLSSVIDPYQPVEERYELVRSCLKLLLQYQFPVSILTKSPLVIRDIDLLRLFTHCEVGLSITTDDDFFRQVFEPYAPTIAKRFETLATLRQYNIKTYVFIGPMLPMDVKCLVGSLRGLVDRVIIDKLNYPSKVRKIYFDYNISYALSESYFKTTAQRLTHLFRENCIVECSSSFALNT